MYIDLASSERNLNLKNIYFSLTENLPNSSSLRLNLLNFVGCGLRKFSLQQEDFGKFSLRLEEIFLKGIWHALPIKCRHLYIRISLVPDTPAVVS